MKVKTEATPQGNGALTTNLKMMMRANEVRVDGRYLDIVDVFFFAHMKQKELTLLFMEDATVKLVKAADHLKEICPDLVTEPLPAGSDNWNILMCTANYKSSPEGLLGLNHFVPAFPMNVVPGLVLQEQADRFTQEMKQIAVEKAKTLKAWLDAEQKHDGSTDIDMIEAVFNSKTAELQERREQIKSFQKLLGEAQAKGFALFEVPADGNCAVHGLCNLLSGTPGNGSPPAVVAAVREEIAQAWEKATEDSNWTEVFEKLVAVFDPDPEPAKASKAKKEVKMEQTPQRSQRGPISEIIDLMTPPKVQSVGAKRGAFDQSNLSKDVDMSGLGLDELDPPGEV